MSSKSLPHEEVLERIKAGQGYISTEEDLTNFGFNKKDKSKIGAQRWVSKTAQQREYQKRDKFLYAAKTKKWRRENPEKVKTYHAKYSKMHPEIKRAGTAKRKRNLGYTLIIPLAEGEVGHHVTDEYVIGVPKEVHDHFSGYSRKKHRTLVLQWLKANDTKKYIKVLCVLAKEQLK